MTTFRIKLEPHEAAVLEIMAEDEGKQPSEKMRELLRDGAMRYLGGSSKRQTTGTSDRQVTDK